MRHSIKSAALFAASVLAASTAGAQTITSSPGTSSNVSSITHQISASDMTGMKVTATLEDGSTGFASWGLLSGSTYGVNIFSGQSQIAQVAITPGSSDTFFSDWMVTLYKSSNLKTLRFDGGLGNGGVIFDRCTGVLCLSEGTDQSNIGKDFQVGSNWKGITANYTNGVTLNNAPLVGDLFTTVEVDFTNAEYCTLQIVICISGWNNDVPDVNGPGNPFAFNMDTDKGTFTSRDIVTPEPSTYALMAAGLLGLGIAARRRRSI